MRHPRTRAVLPLFLTLALAAFMTLCGCNALGDWAKANPEAAASDAAAIRDAGKSIGGTLAGGIAAVTVPAAVPAASALGIELGDALAGVIIAALGIGGTGAAVAATRKYIATKQQLGVSEGRHVGWDEATAANATLGGVGAQAGRVVTPVLNAASAASAAIPTKPNG